MSQLEVVGDGWAYSVAATGECNGLVEWNFHKSNTISYVIKQIKHSCASWYTPLCCILSKGMLACSACDASKAYGNNKIILVTAH